MGIGMQLTALNTLVLGWGQGSTKRLAKVVPLPGNSTENLTCQEIWEIEIMRMTNQEICGKKVDDTVRQEIIR